jgi:hypothetical protein
LFEAPFQKDVERDVQEFLIALLLLSSCRPSYARADGLIGGFTNFLALQSKVRIMERTGTIIDQDTVIWVQRLSG